jgi:hypothetical protein
LWKTFDRPLARWSLAIVFAGALTTQASSIVRLHPYQMTYFNCLAGGVRGAAGQYETDYWLTSYKEAIEWIEMQPASPDGRKTRVLVAANENSRWCAAYFAGQRLKIETTLTGGQSGDLPPGIDYYIGTSRSGMDQNFSEATIVHRVGRAGAVFTTIKQRLGLATVEPK